ncbi:MAG: RES domain-containing protein [Thermomicrobiales bacterium]|nr:MAG: RES domain-containing protein [Thermomicrobiales bacterium]
MIQTTLDSVTAYRIHCPKWAFAPTSGEGAARHGGRVNRPGVAALYLALDAKTAISEYQQVSRLVPPGTLVSYQVTAAPVIDFSNGYSPADWDSLWEDFNCDWRALWYDQRVEPPSWVLGDQMIAAGAKGILFESRLEPGGRNLALYTANLAPTDLILAYDPNEALPKNQASWLP